MRRHAPFSSLLLAALLAGCGGSHHDSPATDNPVASGAASLSSAFTNSDDAAASLKSAQKAFDTAYARAPNDPRTALGYGVSTLALDASRLDDAVTASRAQGRKDLAGLRTLTALDGLGSRLGASTRASLRLTLPTFAFGFQSRADGLGSGDLKAIADDLRKVVSRLTNDRIEALEANPLVLTIGDDGGVVVKLGTVEAYALRAATEAAISGVDGTLAYDLESEDHASDVFETKFAAQIAASAAIAPNDYLPSADFGKLQSNGGTLLTELRADLSAAATDGNLALTRLGTRTATGYLTDLSPITSDQKAAVKTQLDLVAAVAAGPTRLSVATPGGSVDVTVNLPVVVASPPNSLRAFFPSVKASTTDDGTVTLAPVSGSIADATLGGLVPGGAPDAILYGRTLSLDDATTQGEVADWASPLGLLSGS